jgi:GH25 family lysozyme M1 (1,4-beta-N-acetylmuramidase)
MTDFEEALQRRGLRAGAVPLSYRIMAAFIAAARGEPIPVDKRRKGYDLSHWNSTVNHQTAVNADIQFAYFRATLGTSYFDDQYNNNRTNAADRYPWGSYHALTTAAGGAQANWFCNNAENHQGKLPPVVDVELQAVDSASIKSFILQTYSRLGIYPIIYTSAYFWGKVTGTDKAWVSAHCPLWVAHWGTDNPILPPGWATYAIHQYSADGNGLGPTYGAPPEGDHDMDLDYTNVGWLNQYLPPSDWEHRADAFLRTLGFTGPGPE